MREVNLAQQALLAGGVIVYPTETSYGLGCLATDLEARARIYKLKGRALTKSLPVLVSSWEMAQEVGLFSEKARLLAAKYWPGPLTLVLPLRDVEQGGLLSRAEWGDSIAIRWSAVKDLQTLTEVGPVVATSANYANQKACYNEKCIWDFVGQRSLDYLWLAGDLPKVKATTIIEVVADQVTILRQGKLTLVTSDF